MSTNPVSDQCLWCRAFLSVHGHNEGCPMSAVQKIPKRQYENLIITEQETAFRLKNVKRDSFYDPERYVGTRLGKLYSLRGFTSLISYKFVGFVERLEDWEVIEYLVDDKIHWISQEPLEKHPIYLAALERRKNR